MIGECLLSLGRYEDASTRLQQSLDMSRLYLGDIHHNVARIQLNRARCDLAQGAHIAAQVTLLPASVEELSSNLAPPPMHTRCRLQTNAKSLVQSAAQVVAELSARDDCGVALPAELASVSAAYSKFIGNYTAAALQYKRAIDMYNEIFASTGPSSLTYKTHPIIAMLLLDYGDVQRLRGHYDDAEKLVLYAGDIIKETVGKEHALYAVYEQV